MKKNQRNAAIVFVVVALFFTGRLSAQWITSGNLMWAANTDMSVGIGTTTPTTARLQFDNALGNKITLRDAGNGKLYGFGTNNYSLVAYIPDVAGERFSVRLNNASGPEKFVVARDGSVGLGGTWPSYARLQFDNALGNKIMMYDNGNNVGYGFGVTANNLSMYIPYQNGVKFSLRSNSPDGAERFSVLHDGKTVIGSRLYVGANGTENGYSLVHFKNGTTSNGGIIRASKGSSELGDAPLILQSSVLSVQSSGQTRLFVNSSGNVGIGTTNLPYKLCVNGAIRAKEVRVETGWADYVFEPDYTLRPLAEVEAYIRKNKHLPDVTPAADIQRDGLQVGEQMTQMMRKIEELTLYVIDLKKENSELKSRLEKLEK
jgi:hypothetical protein